MAMMAIRLRRALSVSSSPSLLRAFSTASTSSTSPASRSPSSLVPRTSCAGPSAAAALRNAFDLYPRSPPSRCIVVRCRMSGSGSVYSPLDSDYNREPGEIKLFEGVDYEHWLITMEFPQKPPPSREEMIDTFVKTLATVVGSEEEAKKRIYAVCTTTYIGFQARISEALSEEIKKRPGVVWVLPDSYHDPIKREYGSGDLYDNGVITPRPRPPPQQGRYNDRPRNYDRPRFDRRRDSMPVERRDPYGTPGERRDPYPMQGERRDPMPVEGRDSIQGERRDYRPVEGRDDMREERRDYRPMEGRDSMQGERRDYRPMEGRDSMQGERREYGPTEQRDPMQGERREYGPTEQRDPMQGERRDYMPPFERRDSMQGERRNYIPAHERRGQMQAERRDSPQMEERFSVQSDSRGYGQSEQRYPPQGRDV